MKKVILGGLVALGITVGTETALAIPAYRIWCKLSTTQVCVYARNGVVPGIFQGIDFIDIPLSTVGSGSGYNNLGDSVVLDPNGTPTGVSGTLYYNSSTGDQIVIE